MCILEVFTYIHVYTKPPKPVSSIHRIIKCWRGRRQRQRLPDKLRTLFLKISAEFDDKPCILRTGSEIHWQPDTTQSLPKSTISPKKSPTIDLLYFGAPVVGCLLCLVFFRLSVLYTQIAPQTHLKRTSDAPSRGATSPPVGCAYSKYVFH